jgi:hypothetical protein
MSSIEKTILDVLDSKHPENVKELILLVQEQVESSTEEIQKQIKSLHKQGLVTLEEPTSHQSFFSFIRNKQSLWFWIILAISAFSLFSILFVNETQTTLAYIRYSFGFVLVAFLPGYCLTEALFPRKQTLDLIERITFSIGLSFAITALVGLFLSFTPFGLKLSTALPSLGGTVIFLAITALARKYQKQ